MKKFHYRRLFLCCHTQRIHSTLNYTQRLYVVFGCTVQNNASVNQQLLLHQHARETRAEHDTQLVSPTAILMFRVTPMMSDELQQTLRPREPRGGGVTGLLAEFVAVTCQTDTTGVIRDSWLQRGWLQLAAETDMLPRTFTDTDHGLLSQVKWRDIGRSFTGHYLFIAWRGRDARVAT